jgi:hypothetical protein
MVEDAGGGGWRNAGIGMGIALLFGIITGVILAFMS